VGRKCAFGLHAVAMASHRILAGEADAVMAGGVEPISLMQAPQTNRHRARSE
jgi:acetyl-CoA C-acetyltransferase